MQVTQLHFWQLLLPHWSSLTVMYEASAQLTDAAGGAGFIAAGDAIEARLVIDGETVDLTPGAATFADTDTIQDVIDAVNNSGRTDVEARFNIDKGQIEIQFDESIGQVELELEATAGGDVVSFGFALVLQVMQH